MAALNTWVLMAKEFAVCKLSSLTSVKYYAVVFIILVACFNRKRGQVYYCDCRSLTTEVKITGCTICIFKLVSHLLDTV